MKNHDLKVSRDKILLTGIWAWLLYLNYFIWFIVGVLNLMKSFIKCIQNF